MEEVKLRVIREINYENKQYTPDGQCSVAKKSYIMERARGSPRCFLGTKIVETIIKRTTISAVGSSATIISVKHKRVTAL